MASLSESVKKVKNVLDGIGEAIKEKGVDIPEGTKAGKYPELIKGISGGAIDACDNFSHMFREDNRIDVLIQGLVNTSHVKDMSYMAYNSKNLTYARNIDFLSAENTSYMFYDCEKLISVNDSDTLDMPNVKNASNMFFGCEVLRNIRYINCKSLESGAYMFRYSLPQAEITIDLPAKIDARNLFYTAYATGITINTPTVVTNANNMFAYASNLVYVDGLDLSGVVTGGGDYAYIFRSCTALERLTLTGSISDSDIAFDSCTKLTHESLIGILNALCENGTSTCKLGSTNLAKLTDEEKVIATNKGWTLA